MNISDNILRECLKNVYFINGTSYAGKSTMVRLLAEKHGMIHCGENYHDALSRGTATPEMQPNLSYFKTMRDWQEFIHRTPDAYERWISGGAEEASEFEIAILLQLSAKGQKIIVDTNISVEHLRVISSYDRVAIMLSPQSLSVARFFDRDDADKQFLLRQIEAASDPVWAMENFLACMARVNSEAVFNDFKRSGFFTIYRESDETDTRNDVLYALENHFGLTAGKAAKN